MPVAGDTDLTRETILRGALQGAPLIRHAATSKDAVPPQWLRSGQRQPAPGSLHQKKSIRPLPADRQIVFLRIDRGKILCSTFRARGCTQRCLICACCSPHRGPCFVSQSLTMICRREAPTRKRTSDPLLDPALPAPPMRARACPLQYTTQRLFSLYKEQFCFWKDAYSPVVSFYRSFYEPQSLLRVHRFLHQHQGEQRANRSYTPVAKENMLLLPSGRETSTDPGTGRARPSTGRSPGKTHPGGLPHLPRSAWDQLPVRRRVLTA